MVACTRFPGTILPRFENVEEAAVGDNSRASNESGRAPPRQRTPALRWHPVASKRFANSQTKGVAVPALGDVRSKIDVVLLAELKTQSAASGRQEFGALHNL